jgi:hypothetical protein
MPLRRALNDETFVGVNTTHPDADGSPSRPLPSFRENDILPVTRHSFPD